MHTAGFAHPHTNVGLLDITPGMTVVDFGAGSGAYALSMAQRLHESGHVYAIDIQKGLLQKLKNEAHHRGLKNVDIVWADLEQPGSTNIADHSVDLVLISNLLFQIDHKIAVLREARRILKAVGRLAIIDWQESYGGMGPHKDAVVTKDQALDLARQAGFDLLRPFPAGAHHYGYVFRLAPHFTV
jgi:ubiquinone/menaquinone biosynthesis C-methylase UbiE